MSEQVPAISAIKETVQDSNSLFMLQKFETKGITTVEHLCHSCSAHHGWLRELNAASPALVGRTWRGFLKVTQTDSKSSSQSFSPRFELGRKQCVGLFLSVHHDINVNILM